MPKKYKSKPRNRNKNKKPSKNYKKYKRSTSNMIISRPLLPETQKVCLKYYTRVHIDPVMVKSAANQTANNMAMYTFAFNDPYDPDKSQSIAQAALGVTTGHLQDGQPDHQPRMYDQYSSFYEKITVLGAKADICFSNSGRQSITTTVNQTLGSQHGTMTDREFVEPLPSYVGYLNSQWYDEPVATVRWDDVREKNEVRYRRLVDHDKPQKITAKWSLNKDKGYKSQLGLDKHEAPENFTSDFGHSPSNLRFLHLFAHPVTVTNTFDPQPIDVEVEISQICLLSGRKEIVQS